MPPDVIEPILMKDTSLSNEHPLLRLESWKWWTLVIINIVCLVFGQVAAVLLGRYYYDKGGNSTWLATLLQTVAFPILLIPYFMIGSSPKSSDLANPPSPSKVALTYIVLGAFIAGDNMLYSIGLRYLSASTYSLICATQLISNAIFSYFINNQQFTDRILTSVVSLTLSAALIAINGDSTEPSGLSKGKYILGFVTTLGASTVYSLILSLMQLSFQKVLKKETFSVVLEMQIYTSVVATVICIIGLFASGESKSLHGEMIAFSSGKVAYVLTVVWTAIAWQVCAVGVVGLIFVVTSLFSNVISTLSLAITPLAALIVFHDKMNGVKIIAMLMALWGFSSYLYQNYIDDVKELRLLHQGSPDQACKSVAEDRVDGIEGDSITDVEPIRKLSSWQWWILVIMNIAFLLLGQIAAVLLGRFYYDKGGNSNWLATLLQTVAFPILFIPYLIIKPSEKPSEISEKSSSPLCISFIYLVLGALIAGDNMLYSVGLRYLSASTYSLISATQLISNAIFSFFINKQKFTDRILNSVVVLTVSAALIAINGDSSEPAGISKGKFFLGFITTLGASTIYSLILSLMQLSFEKVIKKDTFSVVLEMQIYTSLVATCVCIIGLFASGEWKTLHGEMIGFSSGQASYVLTVVFNAVTWQICAVGVVGLIYAVSSLFSNVISTLSLAITPLAALVFFRDKMSKVKIVAMVLAFWGFASYIRQNYIDDRKVREAERNAQELHSA